MAVYKWRAASENFFGKADPQQVGERLEWLKQRKADKKITASDVVQDAAKRSSPLHPLFEWSDAEAANKYREQQARQVIGALVVTVHVRGKEEVEERAFVSVGAALHSEDPDNSGYLAVSDLSASKYAEVVAKRARNELKNWTIRYAGVEELAELIEQVRGLVDEEALAEV